MAVEVQLQLENTLVTKLRRSGLLRLQGPTPRLSHFRSKTGKARSASSALTQAGMDSIYEKVR
jgi:hypothetical protein